MGNKIKELRLRFGLKQIDLANSVGVSPQAVSKWEKDENFPDILLIRKIASLFDISLDSFLGHHEENRDEFEATVFCSSLNHFADRAKTLSAKEVAQWSNVVFHHMTDIVVKYGGVPVKYTGDGFLCFFSGAEHAERAFKAACDIDRINPDKDIVIFLNSGDIYFGLVGHPDYASKDISGDAVYRAFLVLDEFSKHVQKGVGMTEEVKSLTKEAAGVFRSDSLKIPVLNEQITVYTKG
ncbi:MAG: helix-turn-helix domain-containing protein [Planctomycetota bacterium]|nr:helix-turn-helix domain-containing protein [Planctomycetota bacterium]MEC7428146.1 helix-turn-helix domain-containing protein [Planctomycetota bacterium]MEC8241607.1 helix-turn-helix domain-containing protein [Planctomycetota bacterium]MEC8571751.1 helix-turn-helix domain-containing protein [Planctomycetota bacterium]MEC8801665.1 helix-turn-helix domain-containing protein [Planctomycetota bacterium]